MADYYSVLKKTVAALPENTGAARRNIYQRARTAIVGQLKAYDPPLSPSEITSEQLRLEEAIRKVEAEAARETLGLNKAPQEPAAPGFARKPDESSQVIAEPTGEFQEEKSADVADDEIAQSDGYAAAPPSDGSSVDTVPPSPDARGQVRDVRPDSRAGRAGERQEPTFGTTQDEQSGADEANRNEDKSSPRHRRRHQNAAARKAQSHRPSGEGKPSRLPVVMAIGVAFLVLIGLAAIGYSQRDVLYALLEDTTSQDSAPQQTVVGEQADGPSQEEQSAAGGKIEERLPGAGGNAATGSPAAPDARSVTTTRISPGTSDGDTDQQGQSEVRRVQPRQVEPEPEQETAAEEQPAPESAQPQSSDADAAGEDAETATADVDTRVDDTPAPASDDNASDGEETTTASLPRTEDSTGSSQETPAVAAVAQRSILYEEGPDSDGAGSASPGQAVWSLNDGSSGEDAVLRVDAEISERNINAEVTIKPNTDDSLPASHLVEVQFNFPEGFEGRGVANVPGLVMKMTEEARGDALIGASVKVSDNLFWVALSNVPSERDRNIALLRERGWIDIPILYEDGKRAILTLEKGTPGSRAVEQALASWQ